MTVSGRHAAAPPSVVTTPTPGAPPRRWRQRSRPLVHPATRSTSHPLCAADFAGSYAAGSQDTAADADPATCTNRDQPTIGGLT